MRKWLLVGFLISACWCLADILPETMRVYPTPQEVTRLGGDTFAAPDRVKIVPDGLDADAVRVIAERFPVKASAAFTIAWARDTALPKEGYSLALSAKGAQITAADASGFFYAAKTLLQLLASGNAEAVRIRDWPTVPFRGTVEGFYGQPWSFEARKSQFRFYGDWKMNTYIYGPKDDPYHGFSTRWREPYPLAEAKRLAELVRVAHKNKVNFVWAVHPGRDIHWKDDSDIRACIAKFERMYALGVRSFAVFFDDIGGGGARAEKQVELLNAVNRRFVRVKKDVTPLLLCPTQYNRAWSHGSYLETLGKGLDPDIRVMWTGDSVCTDIPRSSMEWINAKLGRKAYVWWNWPVADYCRSAHLLLGRTYGLDLENGPLYAGFVSNPMDKPEASKIGLFGVADYAWNPAAFQSEQAWRDGIRRMFPECAGAVQCFAEHNSDQGANGHGYRREESVAIRPAVERLTQALKAKSELPEADVQAVRAVFAEMAEAGQTILSTCKNALFLEDVADWCRVFVNTGLTGVALMDALTGEASETAALNMALNLREKNAAISRAHAAKPFQKKPTEVATRVLVPFLNLVEETVYQRLWQSVAGKPAPKAASASYVWMTNISSLQGLQVIRDGIYVRLPKVHEPKTVAPGEWFGIRLPEGVPAVWAHFILEADAAIKQGRLEVSSDGGKTWHVRRMVCRGNGQQGEMELRNIRPADGVNAVRYVNISNKPVTVTLRQVKVDVPANAVANDAASMCDGDLRSGYTLAPNRKVKIPLSGATAENTCVLASGTVTAVFKADGVTLTAGAKGAVVYEIVH